MSVYGAVVAVVWNRIEMCCASPNVLIESPKVGGEFGSLCNAQIPRVKMQLSWLLY